jgi:hypothetical protein
MENAYVFPVYRGTGVLVPAVGALVEAARAAGVARILTSIPAANMNSLMSFARMGFTPLRVRLEKRRFGMGARRVLPVSSCNDLRSFAQYVGSLATRKGPVPETIVF